MSEEKINLKFRKSITSQAWLKKSEYYTFGFTKKQINEAKKRNHKNPLIILDKDCFAVILLYSEKGELRLNYFPSYYGFKEGLGTHKLEKKFDNCVKCTCGKVFYNKKRKKGSDYLKEHIRHMEKLANE